MNDQFFDINAAERNNKETEKGVLELWDSKPETFHGYIREDGDVTTWLGAKIGIVTLKNTFKNNLGKVITTLRVRGTNGCMYYGAYGSEWANVCRLRKSRRLKYVDEAVKERQGNAPRS